jgi:hypothetical protein
MPVDCFAPHDWSRSYVLPADVEANIPLRGSVGMLGAHNAARGILVETCRRTGARPAWPALRGNRAGHRLGRSRRRHRDRASAQRRNAHRAHPHPAQPPQRRSRRRLVDQHRRCRTSRRGPEAATVPADAGLDRPPATAPTDIGRTRPRLGVHRSYAVGMTVCSPVASWSTAWAGDARRSAHRGRGERR